jgi:hypothetical protein
MPREEKKRHMKSRRRFFLLPECWERLSALFIIVLVILPIPYCAEKPPRPPFVATEDPKVIEILSTAFQRAGGWARYQALDSIAYRKRSILYDSTGKVESDRVEYHSYRLRPSLFMRIAWREGKTRHEIRFDGRRAQKYIDEQPAEADPETSRQAATGALFVLFTPFKLLDGAAKLSYQGLAALPNGRAAHSVAADYESGDDWVFYFDANDGDFIANLVKHHAGPALIVNDDFVVAGGLRFNASRTSYRLDARGDIAYQRGSFFYDAFEVW